MAKFIDEAKLEVVAGNGGSGIITFRREKYVDRGGPDGGDGGNGGSIILRSTFNLLTLIDLKYKKRFVAKNGGNGERQNRKGKTAANLIVNVPIGTQIFDKEKKLIVDLVYDNQEFIVAKGGTGGKGNARFKSSKHQAPTISENGTLGENKIILLELKVLADAGFVGMPSVGKSTLLSKLTSAKPKIASYDFTTLVPQLGIAKVSKDNSFVIADLPGLIKGASENKGLGHMFLKHIERCKIIVHLLDGSNEIKKIRDSYDQINKELNNYDKSLLLKKQIIVINKLDLINSSKIEHIKKEFKGEKLLFISALNNKNLKELLYIINDELLKEIKKISENEKEVYIKFVDEEKKELVFKKIEENLYSISGEWIDYWLQKIPLITHSNINRFNKKLVNKKANKSLIKLGAKKGDIIRLGNIELEMEFDG